MLEEGLHKLEDLLDLRVRRKPVQLPAAISVRPFTQDAIGSTLRSTFGIDVVCTSAQKRRSWVNEGLLAQRTAGWIAAFNFGCQLHGFPRRGRFGFDVPALLVGDAEGVSATRS